ncbi:MAG TPA: CopG family transcriptional regulator [Anaerolineales bacterium]|nr:CopG family transcriptional regulator [Anaerolineales bacterium]
MTTQMVRKQIYIQKRQDALLKRLSQARGMSEAEIIRQAIDRELAGVPAQPIAADRSAWQELVAFLEARQRAALGRQPYRWNREEIYAERESRWLRDQEQD